MAILDRHLVSLVEMLTEVDMDWLAFELIEGVRRGREPVEEEGGLALARQRARKGKAEALEGEAGDDVLVEPLLGGSQLEWAARYVGERIEAILAEISASLGALDEIVVTDRDGQAKTAEVSTVLVLLDVGGVGGVGGVGRVGRTQVEEAQAHLAELRQSLESWLANTGMDLDQ